MDLQYVRKKDKEMRELLRYVYQLNNEKTETLHQMYLTEARELLEEKSREHLLTRDQEKYIITEMVDRAVDAFYDLKPAIVEQVFLENSDDCTFSLKTAIYEKYFSGDNSEGAILTKIYRQLGEEKLVSGPVVLWFEIEKLPLAKQESILLDLEKIVTETKNDLDQLAKELHQIDHAVDALAVSKKEAARYIAQLFD